MAEHSQCAWRSFVAQQRADCTGKLGIATQRPAQQLRNRLRTRVSGWRRAVARAHLHFKAQRARVPLVAAL